MIDCIERSNQNLKLEEDFLKSKYLGEGLSSQEIALKTFSSRALVTKTLKKNGIPLNTITRRTNGSHVFGFRKYEGRSVLSKKEQRIISLIKSYRSSGYSYQKISELLNHQKIETKTRKGYWYPKVVRQICVRNV